ncbi:MAG: hypothetical protein PHT23_08415, partial [Bacteroidales bacterium]|nr:hypothetical protein [Bacteroidales bacterium]
MRRPSASRLKPRLLVGYCNAALVCSLQSPLESGDVMLQDADEMLFKLSPQVMWFFPLRSLKLLF